MTGFYEGTGGVQEPIPHDINTHTDVSITIPTDGQLIVYDESEGLWVNADNPAPTSYALVDLSDVDIPTPTDGQVVSWSDAQQKWLAATVSTETPALTLNDLTDVQIVGVSAGNRLSYDGSFWINEENTIALISPVNIGDGVDETGAIIVLNAGSEATTDVDIASVQFQHGSNPSYTIKSDIQTGQTSPVLSLVNTSGVGANVWPSGAVVLGTESFVPADGYELTVEGHTWLGGDLLVGNVIGGSSAWSTGCSVPLTPTAANQAASKQYVDDAVGTGGGDGVTLDTDQTITGAKKFTAGTVVGGTGDPGAYELLVQGDMAVTNVVATGVTTAGLIDTGGASFGAGVSGTAFTASTATTSGGTTTLTRKDYVDSQLAGTVKTTGNQSISGSKTFSTGVVSGTLQTTGGGFSVVFGALSGTNNQYVRANSSGAIYGSASIAAADVEISTGVNAASVISTLQADLSAAQDKLDNMRSALVGMADIMNITPPQRTQLTALLTSLGIN